MEVVAESSAASCAIRCPGGLEGVITVLAGMSSLDQMKDNRSYMKDFGGLTDKEREVLKNAQEELAKIPLIPCTTCNYCAKVCPMTLVISGSFTPIHHQTLYTYLAAAQTQAQLTLRGPGHNQASARSTPGRCAAICPTTFPSRE